MKRTTDFQTIRARRRAGSPPIGDPDRFPSRSPAALASALGHRAGHVWRGRRGSFSATWAESCSDPCKTSDGAKSLTGQEIRADFPWGVDKTRARGNSLLGTGVAGPTSPWVGARRVSTGHTLKAAGAGSSSITTRCPSGAPARNTYHDNPPHERGFSCCSREESRLRVRPQVRGAGRGDNWRLRNGCRPPAEPLRRGGRDPPARGWNPPRVLRRQGQA